LSVTIGYASVRLFVHTPDSFLTVQNKSQ